LITFKILSMKKNILFLLTLYFLFIFSCKSKEETGIYHKCCEHVPAELDLNPGKIYIPNISTPNGDGINDIFFLHTDDGIEEVEVFRVTGKSGEILTEEFNISTQSSIYPAGYAGTEYGLLSYYLKVRNTNGETFEFNGSFCVYNCGDDISGINFPNCGFPIQHNGQGEFEQRLSSGEADCFN